MRATNKMSGFPSIDKPWLKYYSEDAINTPLPECTIYEYIWNNNKNNLDDIALNYFGRKITYYELFENINKAAKAFSAIGVKKGDCVIIAAVTIPETIYAFYALNRIGAISNMVDPRTSEDGINNYICEVDAKFVLTIDAAYPKIYKATDGTNVKKIIVTFPMESLSIMKKLFVNISSYLTNKTPKLSDGCLVWNDFIKSGKNFELQLTSYKKDSCCAIVHTGGTTGFPKGVMLSNDNLNVMALQYRLLGIEFTRKQNFLNIMPPFIAYGVVLGVHMPISLGLNDILIPQLDPNKFAELVIKYKPSHLAGVPTHYNKLRTSTKIKNKSLDFLCMTGCGGDGMSEKFEIIINDFLKEHNCRYPITKGYGMTEISSAASTNKLELNKVGSVGIPHLKTVISIFKPETDIELKYGEQGEICMCAPTVMLGYYNNNCESKKVLKRHKDGKVWLHSGDIGRMDEDGFLYLDSRIKRIIIRYDGFKIFPSLIEKVILSHPAVEFCCSIGVTDREHSQGRLPAVYIVLKNVCTDRHSKIESELRILCRKELPEYAQPFAYKFCNSLPLTPIGKVDYKKLENVIE